MAEIQIGVGIELSRAVPQENRPKLPQALFACLVLRKSGPQFWVSDASYPESQNLMRTYRQSTAVGSHVPSTSPAGS